MDLKKPKRKRRNTKHHPVYPPPHGMEASVSAGAEASGDSVLAGSSTDKLISLKRAAAYFFRNYAASIAFHAYIAFLPALLIPILGKTTPFSRWSSDALTVLTVFVANATWMEVLGVDCTGDACSAFMEAAQEKQFKETHGSSLHSAKKWQWFLGGASGLLGAVTVGLVIAAFSPLNPFSGVLPLPHELFRRVRSDGALTPSIGIDILNAVLTDEQSVLVASHVQTAAVAVVGWCPKIFDPFLQNLQNVLLSFSPMETFRSISLLLDTFLVEFLLCFIVYLVSSVVTSAAFYLELRHAKRINLAVLLLAVLAGLPFCRIVGGPMLGMSFAALVAGSRLDLLCFILNGSADVLAALCATYFVCPVPRTHCGKQKVD
ncbi:hypothetical protein, conserved [Eimeria necatrix]|uniref:Transmembrane protein n=1 Tax=Eimeria necatrix TaxID=51315 RepID=U6N538_9EIME|nr:hypothetical protein, conserved [Eimeria necatrix]CDJ69840.1 hypothetical protein, conserved [Eimeria necatrix]